MPAKSLIGIDILPLSTLSMGDADPSYPAANGNNRNPADPLKATDGSTTITWGAVALQAFAIINHNLSTASLNGNAITIPARLADGQSVGPWIDLRLIGGSFSSLAATSASNVAIGELVGVQTLVEVYLRPDGSLTFEEDWPHDEIETFYKSKIKYEKGIRIRRGIGTVMRDADRAALRSLWLGAKGGLYPVLLIPEQDKNDAIYGYLKNPHNFSPTGPLSSNMTLEFEEASSSLTL